MEKKTVGEKLAAIEAAAANAVGAGSVSVADVSTDGVLTGYLDKEQLREMTVKELTALAEDMGLEVKRGTRKDDLVDIIAAESVQVPVEEIAEAEPEDSAESAEEGEVDPTEEPEGNTAPNVELILGRVLVTYTGMVNLRDSNMQVAAHAMQGQIFPAISRLIKNGQTWYLIQDRNEKLFWISGDVVKYMK